jgi:hypothetical protein
MAADRTYIAQNDAQRERLRSLVARLSDDDLRRAVGAGWTVAGVLAHVAFWDQRVLVLLEAWERGGAPRPFDRRDVDWINDSAKALCLALPARAAAELALSTATAVDRKLEALSDDRLAANTAAGTPINVLRAEHRREHLDQIERAV